MTKFKYTALLTASRFEQDALLNGEFSFQMLPATQDAIYQRICATLRAEKVLKDRLQSWAASGDTIHTADLDQKRPGGVRIWYVPVVEFDEEALQLSAVSMHFNDVEPDWLVSTMTEASIVAAQVAAISDFARTIAQ